VTRISENFHREEFSCRCGCGKNTIDVELITVLEDLREHFNAPVIVNSGNRCVYYNEMVGGRSGSRHLISKAADITVRGYTPIQVYSYLAGKYIGKYGIGSYESFTHIDVRSGYARW